MAECSRDLGNEIGCFEKGRDVFVQEACFRENY